MRQPYSIKRAAMAVTLPVVLGLAAPTLHAADGGISVTDLDTLLREHPLAAGATSDVVAYRGAGNTLVQVVTESSIPPHVHEDTDHILYIARGAGTANLAGQTRAIKPGDILFIPHGVLHGFEKAPGSENIVMLVVEAPKP
jgi:quercetin dioxygenase-like cupin family protein